VSWVGAVPSFPTWFLGKSEYLNTPLDHGTLCIFSDCCRHNVYRNLDDIQILLLILVKPR
jgi:hypothetical protein